MPTAVNLTPFAVGEAVARGVDGRSVFIVVVKATYSFAAPGRPAGELITPTLIESSPLLEEDRYLGDPGTSGLTHASDMSLPKPAVDVWLAGSLKFPVPVTDLVCGFKVGSRLEKRARVYGERHWLPGTVRDLVPSSPKPMTSLPLAWELACGGGTDKAVDRRNPVGCSVAADIATLQGKPAPRYEAPDQPITAGRAASEPWGFGPVAPHWEPRAALAGTYDESWRDERAPLLPEDFQPAFLNAAPVQQRLPSYLPGEEVQLTYMTAGGRTRFVLPAMEIPVLFITRNVMEEAAAQVDTLIIEPAEERFSLVARAICVPEPNPLAMRQVFVGALTPGRRRAIETGKVYAGPDVPPSVASMAKMTAGISAQ